MLVRVCISPSNFDFLFNRGGMAVDNVYALVLLTPGGGTI